jgi:hypothetical protein
VSDRIFPHPRAYTSGWTKRLGWFMLGRRSTGFGWYYVLSVSVPRAFRLSAHVEPVGCSLDFAPYRKEYDAYAMGVGNGWYLRWHRWPFVDPTSYKRVK